MQVVQRLLQNDTQSPSSTVADDQRARKFHRGFCAAKATAKATAKAQPQAGGKVVVEMYRRNWKMAYAAWKRRLMESKDEHGVSQAPYEE